MWLVLEVVSRLIINSIIIIIKIIIEEERTKLPLLLTMIIKPDRQSYRLSYHNNKANSKEDMVR